MNFINRALRLQKDILEIPTEDIGFENIQSQEQHSVRVTKLLESETINLEMNEKVRILEEFEGFGPLSQLLSNFEITEIIVNSPHEIWYEFKGKLFKHNDQFISDITYENILERICSEAGAQYNLATPFCNGKFKNFRLHLISSEITQTYHSLTLRRINLTPWTFEMLSKQNWAPSHEIQILKKWIQEFKNFIIVGETGSGKTSVLNACLQEVNSNERVVVIEDTPEIYSPNPASVKLLSRTDCQNILTEINLTELVKQSLRMRPDRLVVGEVRGKEAKDLLLALSTGHRGSLGTLHANSSHQALMRLEMLIQMGSPEWDLRTIRRLLHLSLDGIVVVGRTHQGNRILKSIHSLAGLEDSGFLLHSHYEHA